MSHDQVYEVPIKDIEVDLAVNVRHVDAERDLDDLARSIDRHGQLQPILLRGVLGEPPYSVIVGQRRYLAHKVLKRRTINAAFAGNIAKKEAAIKSLAENMHRVELNHADAAAAITTIYRDCGRNERKVAEETGMSLRRVREYIDVQARATPKMKELLKKRDVSLEDVKRALRAGQDSPEKAEKLLGYMVKEKLTTHQKRRVADYGQGNPRARAEEILAEAKRPRIEQRLLVTLPETIRVGLERAMKKLSMAAEEVATKALEEWLGAQGFIA